MQTVPLSVFREKSYQGQFFHDQPSLLAFNRQLDHDAQMLPNEGCLARRLEAFMEMPVEDQRLYWLTLARITELALKLAGDCADNCEFQTAGDLLVNPRRIDIFLCGAADPIVKHRHGSLSGQLAQVIGNADPVAWLSQNSFPRVHTKALLSRLRQMLASSDLLKSDYLADLDRRMGKVADTIAFLMSWRIVDSVDLCFRIQAADHEGAALIHANLCQFNHDIFNAIKADIYALSTGNPCSGAFLSCCASVRT